MLAENVKKVLKSCSTTPRDQEDSFFQSVNEYWDKEKKRTSSVIIKFQKRTSNICCVRAEEQANQKLDNDQNKEKK